MSRFLACGHCARSISRLSRRCVSAQHALSALTESQCASRVLWLAGFVAIVKLFNASLHPGFFSGDDVEVQEMTFAALFHWSWRAWDIRSAFYPMTFILPVQALLLHLGVTDPGRLVFAGRAVVAVISTLSLPLVFTIARRFYGQRVALIAATFLALSSLSVGFGSTELPRPISTVFVLLLFGAVSKRGTRAAVLAGLLAAIAGHSDLVSSCSWLPPWSNSPSRGGSRTPSSSLPLP